MQIINIILALAFGSIVQAHMALDYPPALRAKNNPNANPNTVDYSMTSPLSGASQFPCKGYQSDMGTSAGASVVTWDAGQQYNFSVTGGATHGGGSCQAALSYDSGKTFHVINSYIGSCPLTSGQTFDINIPSDAPSGAALFAWTWYNQIGNREIYQNCASVTIAGASKRAASSTPFSSLPDLFVANLANGCTSVEGKDVDFPNPGPNVVRKLTVTDNSGSFTGTCAAVNGIGGGSAASSGAPASGASGASSAPSSAASSASVTSTPTTLATSASAAAPSVSGGVFITTADSSPVASATSPAATSPVASEAPTSVASASSAASAAPSVVASSSTPASTGTSSVGAIAAGTACTSEGMWNCIGGTSFQRCASGTWSVVQPMAAGTSCTAGQSSTLNMVAIGRRSVRRSLRARGY